VRVRVRVSVSVRFRVGFRVNPNPIPFVTMCTFDANKNPLYYLFMNLYFLFF
jgi:hypothetical protein